MPPNRRARNEGGQTGGAAPQQNQPQRNNHNNRNNAPKALKCVRPKGCLDPSKRPITKEDIENGSIEVVRVTCNNLQCDEGNFMHLDCFLDWETSVLNFLSSTGRARSWSVKQRLQNLWTKKGYDLAFKACDCNCGKGHLRKDLDWVSPKERGNWAQAQNPNQAAPVQGQGEAVNANQNGNNQNLQNAAPALAPVGEGKKKKKKGKESLPKLSMTAPVPHPNDNHSRRMSASNPTSTPIKTNSNASSTISTSVVSSSVDSITTGSCSSAASSLVNSSPSTSPPSTGPWNLPGPLCRPRVNSLSSNASGSSGAYSGTSGSPPSPGADFAHDFFTASGLKGHFTTGEGRTRHNSTGSAFHRRHDFSSFNYLPSPRVNSYNIKMDDEGHEDADMRFVILSALYNQRMNTVNCCLCQQKLLIYEKYPIIDGTFFISPRKYGKNSVLMSPSEMSENSTPVSATRYVTAVCMCCLSGKNGGLVCRGCGRAFDGTALILGAIYNYDVFAAMNCCRRKSACMNCRAYLRTENPCCNQGSQLIRCGQCGVVDYHYAKPVEMVYDALPTDQFGRILVKQRAEDQRKVLRMTRSMPV